MTSTLGGNRPDTEPIRTVVPRTTAELEVLVPVHPGDSYSLGRRVLLVVILGLLTALGPFTIDMYLPAFPVLEREFGVSESAIQLTLTGTMLGFALGQLVVGPWSDRVGRRIPLITTTSVHLLACIGAAMATDIFMLSGFRVLQGMGAAAGGVVAMAMVRDLFGGFPLVRMLSRLALVSGLGPVLAPVIGSQLLLVMGWRGLFIVLAGMGIAVLTLTIIFIRETLPKSVRESSAGKATVMQRYRSLFRDRIFVGVLIVGAMSFTGMFAYLSASPFLFQVVHGLDAQQYGILFAVNSLGIILGNKLAARLSRIAGPQWVIVFSTAVMLLAGIAIVVLSTMDTGFWGVAVPLWIFIAAIGFTFPCTQVLALAEHGSEAATAASVMGAAVFGISGLLSPLVGLIGEWVGGNSAMAMGLMMVGATSVAIIVLWSVVRPRTVPALEH